jgi:hypothetical protein
MDRAVYRVISDYRGIVKGMGVGVKRIILYGSHAVGSPKEYSDIDLVVISDDFEKMDLWERLTLLGRAAARLRKPIEAFGYTEKEFMSEGKSFITDEVEAKGVEVR